MYFDPFGEKVGADGAVASPLLGDVKLGFTSHRHDDDLGLIDMRGRVFDPAQKRFLTPDPHVPDPLSGQSYNRFSYVMNNPLRYTDPSGFTHEQGDLQVKGGMSDPDMAAAPAPVMHWPRELRAAEVVVTAKADDTGERPPQEPISKEEQERKWADFFKKMSWGGAKQLLLSAPPVVMARQIHHNAGLVSTAVKQARAGDWNSAASTLLEMPQQTAEGAARIITGPIEAALAVPAGVRTVLDSEADPEKRGAAAIITAQNVATVALTVTAAAGAVKGATGRARAQERLKQIAEDPNTSSADRGWIKQEQNAIARGQRPTIRVPPGKQLAHSRGREAAKGYDHVESPSTLQDTDLHRTQHKFDNFGRANKERL